ncbi:hypothetical protein M5M_07357 [Simiduia agarivorans SA1 = DSM 21679]|uniref:Uncharacterized protein n=1 Tax=Simiduia agarivorans (strain DSM 21679 / JCM 13881 / BCRC 17597 / SA1) TaxID=1117647 RepID=R9S4Z1_SIMAS|nr:hypothetical protein M5M_07357 [Simiduia agarivorans SA1 = DSM 21679]
MLTLMYSVAQLAGIAGQKSKYQVGFWLLSSVSDARKAPYGVFLYVQHGCTQ